MTDNPNIFEKILIFALVLSVLVRNFSFQFPEHFFYISESILLFVVSLCLYSARQNFITFLMFGLSLGNLFDELFFNPKELELNEFIFAIVLTLIAVYRYVPRTKQSHRTNN